MSGSSVVSTVDNYLLKEISEEFNQRMILLSRGMLKVSRDPSDYPIHKAIFDGTLDQIVELSFTDKATLTSLKLSCFFEKSLENFQLSINLSDQANQNYFQLFEK